MRKIGRLLSGREYGYLLLSVVLIVAQVYFELRIPRAMGDLTNLLYSSDASLGGEMKYGLFMLGFALLSLALSFAVSCLLAKVAAVLDRELRSATFSKIMDFSLSEVGELGSSSLIARCTNDIVQVQSFLSNGFSTIVKSPVMIVWVTAQIAGANAYYKDTTVGAVALLAVVLSAIAVIVLPIVNKAQRMNDDLIRIDKEHIDGIRVVHAYNGYEKQKERHEAVNKKVTTLLTRYNLATSLFAPFSNLVMYGLTVVIYLIGSYIVEMASAGEKAAMNAELLVFVSMLSMLISSCIYLILILTLLPNLWVSIRRIAEVLNKPVSIKDPEAGGKEPFGERGTIQFKNVSFRYPGSREYALKDISFDVKRGETVAIVGSTGSGKTTLLNLIPRLYDADEGEVLVDGINVKEFEVKKLRNVIGYVPQKSFLFSGTVVGNIDYGDNGKLKKAIEEIRKAAMLGQADEFIRAKEGGYDAPVEEGGSNFSGGQRQRLTISRAIARDPEIFLFDDSFSALDYKTDKTLREGLRASLSDTSVLMVAQRISTVKSADQIIVLENGQIAGAGTHEELLESCGVYREIVLSQAETETAG